MAPSSSQISFNVTGKATDLVDGSLVRSELPPLFTAYFGYFYGPDDQVYHAVKTITAPTGITMFAPKSRHVAVFVKDVGAKALIRWEATYALDPAPPNLPITFPNSQVIPAQQWFVVPNTDNLGSFQIDVSPVTGAPFDVEIIAFGGDVS